MTEAIRFPTNITKDVKFQVLNKHRESIRGTFEDFRMIVKNLRFVSLENFPFVKGKRFVDPESRIRAGFNLLLIYIFELPIRKVSGTVFKRSIRQTLIRRNERIRSRFECIDVPLLLLSHTHTHTHMHTRTHTSPSLFL